MNSHNKYDLPELPRINSNVSVITNKTAKSNKVNATKIKGLRQELFKDAVKGQ